MKHTLIIIALFYIQSTFHVDGRQKKSKSVTTLLEAKWRATPLVLETVEYLADENIDFYWNFIDAISHLNPPLNEIEPEKKRYDIVIEHASKLLTKSELALLKLGLSLHIYSPKVQMYRQIALEKNIKNCSTVIDVGGRLVCDIDEAKDLIETTTKNFEHVDVFQIDTHYPGSENRSLTVILYGELGTREFAVFHEELKKQADKGTIAYIIRHFVKDPSGRNLRLSGYGVELQMKSTEYKVQDDTQVRDKSDREENSEEDEEDDVEIEGFNFKTLKNLFPDEKANLERLKTYLEESSNEMAPLKVWQFQDLSMQAAETIMQAPRHEALKVFTNIAQNFPMQAKTLTRTPVNNELKKEIKRNQEVFGSTLNLQPSDTALFVNGLFYDVDLTDVYGILDIIRQELRTMENLHKIGVKNKKLASLLALDFSESNKQEFAIDIRDSAINWINDIETDGKYSRWSHSIMDLLRPTFPGMIRQVRKNLFNLVLVINPKDISNIGLIRLIESFVVHTAPIRVGLVLSTNSSTELNGLTDAGVAMQCAFNYITQKKNPGDALNFLKTTLARAKDEVTVDDIRAELDKNSYDSLEILDEDSDYDFGRQLANDFIERTGQRTLPQALLNGIPLPSDTLNVEDFEETVLREIMSQTSILQKAVYHGKLTNSDNIIDYLMNQPNVMTRLNERILDKSGSIELDLTGKATSSMIPEELLKLSPRDMTATAIENIKYFYYPKKSKKLHTVSCWVVGDLKEKKSRELLLAALEHMKNEPSTRVTFLPNTDGTTSNILNKLVLAAILEYPPEKASDFVLGLLRDKKLMDGSNADEDVETPTDLASKINAQELNLKMLRIYSQRVLGLKSGQRTIVVNGRVLGAFEEDEKFTSEDFALLERFISASYMDKINKVILEESDDENEISSNSLLKIISVLTSRPQTRSRFEINLVGEEHSVLKLPAKNPDAVAVNLDAVVDPVSRGAQKLGPILQVLQEVLNVNVRVFLNSVEKNSDMPLKSFYRFVLEPEIQFNEEGRQTGGPHARFNNMPTTPLLTQNYHVPENWLVEVVRSVYDLDNIRLEDVDSNVHSEYELEYLLLEGHCFEATTGSPPRGLQITLGTETQPVVLDTIVMANLGYFQLKANPGAWILRLRQGRSADIYDIVSHDGTDTPENSTDIKVLIHSLRSHIVKLRVQKKPDKYNVDLLSEDDSANTGIWNSIANSWTGNDEENEEKLNIFSLASGHLYERFLRIMMLSVLKNTKTPVKFWFLKNYLSPQFKDYLPYMSKEYGFEYELVQYKWPRWLHQQTEKQRTIWGYKILFLDVLFPLDVKKIIFVDADQVVRADLKELQQYNLAGAPYGYTPFCDSRREMDGFRFWKHGYWRNHLQGRKYHISALYVVDLKRFRRIAAGDRLRGQYQALSQDPNSLSNLDQDLPNNMIHQVAIRSLPQEWLWCETWCDDDSKQYAKTIDLCNNPMTKEAKLTAAMRILPEWKGYDEEIKNLQKKIDSGVLDSDHYEDSEPSDVHTEL